jgi:CheY-like chemotaxis protein
LTEAPIEESAFAVPAAPSLRGVSVLVVDDDQQALDFVRDTLERHGAIVVTAASPKEARARFKRDPPDVFLSDLVLTGEDGLSLIRDIRQLDLESGRATPAGALTALARTDDRRRAGGRLPDSRCQAGGRPSSCRQWVAAHASTTRP